MIDVTKSFENWQAAAVITPALMGTTLPACRFEPRLCEIVVTRIAEEWRLLNPEEINKIVLQQKHSAVLGVLLENVAHLIPKKELSRFRLWKAHCLLDVKPANGEIFWIALIPFAGRLARELPLKSLKSFRRWGFYGADSLVNKAAYRIKNKTLIGKQERMMALKKLSTSIARITTKKYADSLQGKISQRVAELDLKSAPFLLAVGNTKGKYYRLK